MRIAVLNTYDQCIAFLDNEGEGTLGFYRDELHNYLTGSANTFEFTCRADHEDSNAIAVGNKLAFIYNDRSYYLNIENVKETETELEVVAYSATLELLNEEKDAYTASKAMSFVEYLNVFDKEHTLTVGLNEISSYTRKLEWEGRDTTLARLFSLATQFDAEIELVPVLNHDHSLKEMQINIYHEHGENYQGVGKNRTDEILRYGSNIEGVTRTADITEMYTAIRPVGSNKLTINTKSETIKDKNDEVLYYTNSGSPYIYAPQSRNMFPSNLMSAETNRYIVKWYDYETSSVETLYGHALAELKKHCLPKLTYDVKGYVDANVGDTFMIQDEGFHPKLYIQARVTEQRICFTDKRKNKTTFDNYIEFESQVNVSLRDKVAELEKTIELLTGCIMELSMELYE